MTAPVAPPDKELTYSPRHRVDLGFALSGIKTVHRRNGVHWWLTTTPQGPATVAFRTAGSAIRADAWGPGTEWALDRLPRLLGRDDDLSGFELDHPALSAAARRFSSLRIGATDRWYEAAATSAIGQRVVKGDASTSRIRLSRRHGARPPGNPPGALFPTPDQLLALSDHDLHRAGIERARGRVLRVAATNAARLERLADSSADAARRQLLELAGIGPWTAGLTAAAAGGDADAVPVGDLHLPRMVCFALTGETDGDDTRMLELLDPFAPHRQRVVRLVKLAGLDPPRHAPAPFRFDISGT